MHLLWLFGPIISGRLKPASHPPFCFSLFSHLCWSVSTMCTAPGTAWTLPYWMQKETPASLCIFSIRFVSICPQGYLKQPFPKDWATSSAFSVAFKIHILPIVRNKYVAFNSYHWVPAFYCWRDDRSHKDEPYDAMFLLCVLRSAKCSCWIITGP